MTRIVVLPGDGIGPEVIREAVACLEFLSIDQDLGLEFEKHDFGGVAIDRQGSPLPPATLDACRKADAILLGAVGGEQWVGAPERPEAGLLQLREALDLYANLRPARVIPGLEDESPLRREVADGADILVVRELTGGLYYGAREEGSEHATDTCVYTRAQVERIAHVAFDQARKRRSKVTSVDKANVLATSRLWREAVIRVAQDYPDVALDHLYVDACAMAVITQPRSFDVLLTENLFGDILSDLLSVIGGSIGLCGSASMGVAGSPSLFEPIHGSAPQLAGLDIANPSGAIASAAMLLDTIGAGDSGRRLADALDTVLASGQATPDLGGDLGCAAFGSAVRAQLERSARQARGFRELFMTNRGCCG